MTVLNLKSPAGDFLRGRLVATQPAVARLAGLVATDILGPEIGMVRAEVAFEKGAVKIHIFPRVSGLMADGKAAGLIGADIARLTGCDAVAVDLWAGSPGWFE